MPNHADRMTRFQEMLEGQANLVFFPMGTDLDYLTGIHRDIPNYGRNLHPGMWLEGMWIAPGRAPILTLPRMTPSVVFSGSKGATSTYRSSYSVNMAPRGRERRAAHFGRRD